ncbi:MAG: CysB family HTH-type transcriptional regulator [Neisseria sp.]|nr:CysB family HTH-type transcriptional regulator [Neisseria sp.]
MKLQQLRYVLEVYKQNLNVSAAADALFTSQPGISKQIRLLEDELGVQIFVRQGKKLSAVTEPGLLVLETAERILRETQNIKKIGDDFSRQDAGRLVVATSHTQARYVLPEVIRRFLTQMPDVDLRVQTGDPSAVCAMVEDGTADIGIATEVIEHYPDLCHMPCGEWNRCLIVPRDHVWAQSGEKPSLQAVSAEPLITYDFAFDGQSQIAQAFQAAQVDLPRVVLSSSDADVIKTYVRLGLGVGLIAQEAFDHSADDDLLAIDASHLFAPSVTRVVLRRDRYLRGFMYAFITCFAPNLTRDTVSRLLYEPPAEDYSI